MRNSLFPQCKTSIGNNPDSIKDGAEQFVYSRKYVLASSALLLQYE